MNRANSIIKPYLRRLVLQTHPDYFQHNPVQKKTNASSLQKLNELLQSPVQNKKQQTVKLEFFSKQQKKSVKPLAVGVFDLSDSEWTRTQSVFELCRQLDITVMQADLEAVQDMIQKEHTPYPARGKSLTKEFAEKLYKHYQQDNAAMSWNLKDVLENNMIVFGPSVDKTRVAQNLCLWLPQLQPQKWWNKIPVLVLSSSHEKPSREASKGMIVLHSDISFEELERYLQQHLDQIIKETRQQQ